MFAACRAQWQGENYSLYWVLLEHKMHIKSFYALMLQFALPGWQGAPTYRYQLTHLVLQRGIQCHMAHVSCWGTFSHTCSAAAQIATNHWLTASKSLVCDHSFPFLDTADVLQRLLPCIVQNHSTKGYVYCTAGTIFIQPLKLPSLSLAWCRKQSITVLGEQRLRVC